MTNRSLAGNYLERAKVRVAMLSFLMERQDYADVVREAQEAVELALKGMLRTIGIEPPKWHDVGELLAAYAERFPLPIRERITRLVEISKWLRAERELSFYEDDEINPGEHYGKQHAEQAMDDARFAMETAHDLIKRLS